MLFFFFFNDTATTEIYTLSLHDALPISRRLVQPHVAVVHRAQGRIGSPDQHARPARVRPAGRDPGHHRDRSEEHTSELQSQSISYAVFCLKKKKNIFKFGTR